MQLRGKVAIVTGGAKGIGRAIALAYAGEGCNLVISDILPAEAAAVCEEAGGKGVKAISVRTDVTDERQVGEMVDKAAEEFGRVDILVNNAGIMGPLSLITEISKQQWDEVININLTSMFLCSRAVAAPMIRQGGGTIINLSSDAGRRGARARTLPYMVSKFGIEGFTYVLAMQLAEYGISVNAIRPGKTATDIYKGTPTGESEAFKLLPKPEGVSRLAVYLARQTPGTMTGESVSLEEWNAAGGAGKLHD